MIFDEAMALLKERGAVFVDRFVPYFLCSFGCHAFNLDNQKRKYYYEHDRIPDMRLHIIMVAPPGFSKSFFLKQLLSDIYGLFSNLGLPVAFEGRCTEAGLIGTITNGVHQIGLAEEYATGIVGIEEFSAITFAMKQEHSLTLEPALNQALEGGHVTKRLAKGKIEYQTYFTLWAGTQISRFDVSSGLGRRFLFVYWVPSDSDFQTLIDAVWSGVNVRLPPQKLQSFHATAAQFLKDLVNLKRVHFSDKLKVLLSSRPHYEHLIFRKLALGYNLLVKDLSKTRELEVELDNTLTELIKTAVSWRVQLLADAEGWQVITLLQTHGGKMKWSDLAVSLLRYGLSYSNSSALIKRLLASRTLIYSNGEVSLAP